MTPSLRPAGTCPRHGAILRPVVAGAFRLCPLGDCGEVLADVPSRVAVAPRLADELALLPLTAAGRAWMRHEGSRP